MVLASWAEIESARSQAVVCDRWAKGETRAVIGKQAGASG
jgi:hypothetical protein